jgi:hypothetical protein
VFDLSGVTATKKSDARLVQNDQAYCHRAQPLDVVAQNRIIHNGVPLFLVRNTPEEPSQANM